MNEFECVWDSESEFQSALSSTGYWYDIASMFKSLVVGSHFVTRDYRVERMIEKYWNRRKIANSASLSAGLYEKLSCQFYYCWRRTLCLYDIPYTFPISLSLYRSSWHLSFWNWYYGKNDVFFRCFENFRSGIKQQRDYRYLCTCSHRERNKREWFSSSLTMRPYRKTPLHSTKLRKKREKKKRIKFFIYYLSGTK